MKSAMFIYFLLVCSVNLVSGKHFLYTYLLFIYNINVIIIFII